MAAPINDVTKVNEIITALEGNTLEQLGADWTSKINEAWNLLGIDLRLKRNIDMFEISTTDSEGQDNGVQQQLTYAQAFKVLHLIFLDNLDNVNPGNENVFQFKAEEYGRRYDRLIDEMKIPLDTDSDGNADTDETAGVRLII